MKSWLHSRLATLVEDWVEKTTLQAKPRLCCEVNGISLNVAVDIIVASIVSWSADIVLAIPDKGCQSRPIIVEMSELKRLAEYEVSHEGGIAFVDLVSGGACSFLINYDESDLADILLIASGNRESTIELVKKQFPESIVFRGN